MSEPNPYYTPPPVEPLQPPANKVLRIFAYIFGAFTIPPALGGVWIMLEDAKDTTDMFHGLGYFLGGALLLAAAWCAVCFFLAATRKTFQAQLIWFLLGFLPAFLGLFLGIVPAFLDSY